jgi:heme-degrading monooxygenase HmoA
MIHHLCLIRYKDSAEVTPDIQKAIDAAYLSLPGIIPGILSMQVGRDRALLDGNADFAIYATFESEEAFTHYSVHPAHGEIIFPALGAYMRDYSTAQFSGE